MKNGEIDAGTFFQEVSLISSEAYASKIINEIRKKAEALGKTFMQALYSAKTFIETYFQRREWYPPEKDVLDNIFAGFLLLTSVSGVRINILETGLAGLLSRLKYIN